jgi:hypothetical protein
MVKHEPEPHKPADNLCKLIVTPTKGATSTTGAHVPRTPCTGCVLRCAWSLVLSGVVASCRVVSCCVPVGGADQGWGVGHA